MNNATGIVIFNQHQQLLIIGFVPSNNSRKEIKKILVATLRTWFEQNHISDEIAYLHLFIEIWKNIFDHANNHGCLILSLKDEVLSFKAFDYGMRQIPFSSISKLGYSSKPAGDNRGLGLKWIFDSLPILFDQSESISFFGIRYKGSKVLQPL